MNTIRRTIGLALVVMTLTAPTAAFALEEGASDAERPAVTDATTDTATDRRDLEAVKNRALQTIDKQLAALDRLAGKIADSGHITGEHAASLRADIGTASSGLTELARQIEAATTWAEVRPLIGQIDDWKIAQVLAPKTNQVIASDTLMAAARRLETFSGVLGAVIERFEAAGLNVDEATRLLAEMNDLIAEGRRLADPVAENVIGLQASDWPDPAEAILSAGRSDLREAGGALKGAHRTGGEIVQLLRDLFDGRLDLGAVDEAG